VSVSEFVFDLIEIRNISLFPVLTQPLRNLYRMLQACIITELPVISVGRLEDVPVAGVHLVQMVSLNANR
jgi:hypothetical protein